MGDDGVEVSEGKVKNWALRGGKVGPGGLPPPMGWVQTVSTPLISPSKVINH